MKLVLEISNENKEKGIDNSIENGTIVYKLSAKLVDAETGNEVSGELFWKTPIDNPLFILGDQLEYTINDEEISIK